MVSTRMGHSLPSATSTTPEMAGTTLLRMAPLSRLRGIWCRRSRSSSLMAYSSELHCRLVRSRALNTRWSS